MCILIAFILPINKRGNLNNWILHIRGKKLAGKKKGYSSGYIDPQIIKVRPKYWQDSIQSRKYLLRMSQIKLLV